MTGCDVSAWQGAIHWPSVANAAIDFAYLKASEGIGGTDSSFRSFHDGAKAVGLPVGAYHFLHFGQDPIAQAEHFLAVIAGYEGELLPMVDVEGGGQDGVTDLASLESCLSLFLQNVEKSLGGKRCIIYADYGDWNGFMQGTDAFSGHPFWVAEYNSLTRPDLPTGFTDWVIWQYTSGVVVAGIAGAVDLDRLNGNDLGIIRR